MSSRIQALTVLWAAFFVVVPAGYGQEKPAAREPLKFAPLHDLAQSGQAAKFDFAVPLKVVLVQPSRGIIGRPMNLEVIVENTGAMASTKETGLIVFFQYAGRTEAYGLMVGEVAPQAKRTCSFQYTPRGRLTGVRVHRGSWDTSTTSTQFYGYEMGAAASSSGNLWADYDPKTPLTEFLPKSPSRAKQQAALPATLADVPEVSFAEHLSHAMPTVSAELHFITTIEKIHHVNQKKTDAYMALMREHRPDLAGLPFLLGDACRLKGETSKQFAVETAKIREVQRNFMTIDHLVQQSDLTPPRASDNDLPGNDLIISALASGQGRIGGGSKDWGPEGHGLFSASTRVAAMMQMLTQESAGNRLELIDYLDFLADADATRALAKLAIYSEERQVRAAAVRALKMRRDRDYTDILVSGLSYPWPAVAQRSSEAIVQLGRTDLVPQLIDVLGQDDPRGPRPHADNGKNTKVVKEVVRINHLHNCLLCHAPAPHQGEGDKSTVAPDLTAQIPVPSSPIVQYYGGSPVPDMLVRFDVTYLRQDFTMNLPVKDAKPWPEMQRFDFVVRTREVADPEAGAIGEFLQQGRVAGLSPYQLAALTALRALTGRDAEPTPAAWKTVLSR